MADQKVQFQDIASLLFYRRRPSSQCHAPAVSDTNSTSYPHVLLVVIFVYIPSNHQFWTMARLRKGKWVALLLTNLSSSQNFSAKEDEITCALRCAVSVCVWWLSCAVCTMMWASFVWRAFTCQNNETAQFLFLSSFLHHQVEPSSAYRSWNWRCHLLNWKGNKKNKKTTCKKRNDFSIFKPWI